MNPAASSNFFESLLGRTFGEARILVPRRASRFEEPREQSLEQTEGFREFEAAEPRPAVTYKEPAVSRTASALEQQPAEVPRISSTRLSNEPHIVTRQTNVQVPVSETPHPVVPSLTATATTEPTPVSPAVLRVEQQDRVIVRDTTREIFQSHTTERTEHQTQEIVERVPDVVEFRESQDREYASFTASLPVVPVGAISPAPPPAQTPARARSAELQAARTDAPVSPTIEISIGRIEVLAGTAAAPPRPAKAANGPRLKLSDYLETREGARS